jgi:hypothetical protein
LRLAESSIFFSGGVYFTEFDNRFEITRLRASGSASTGTAE